MAWMKGMKAKAAALVARANMTHSLDDVSKSLGAPVQASPALTRGTDDATFSKALVASLFKAPAGGTVSGPTAGGGYVIARVSGIFSCKNASKSRADMLGGVCGLISWSREHGLSSGYRKFAVAAGFFGFK